MVGKGSVNHNSRKFNAKNTDPERTQYNKEYCNDDIRAVYHELFDEAQKRYNGKQTRADRMINDYYEKIRAGKQEKPFHELILQICDRDDTNSQSYAGELAATVLDEYFKGFSERNPNLRVFSAHLHMDESTPHLHIDFIPFVTGSKRGLDTRVSLKQALSAQGFKGGTKGDTEWNQWVESEKEQLAQIMACYNIAWLQKGTHEKHLSVLEYEKQERARELEALDKKLTDRQDKYDTLLERIQNMETASVEVSDMESKLQTDPEYQLPEPAALMTAKSYHSKIVVPLYERLKKLIRTLLVNYHRICDRYLRLQEDARRVSRENDGLWEKIDCLSEENDRLRKENRDYTLLKKVLGDEQINELLNRVRSMQKHKDKKSYERG